MSTSLPETQPVDASATTAEPVDHLLGGDTTQPTDSPTENASTETATETTQPADKPAEEVKPVVPEKYEFKSPAEGKELDAGVMGSLGEVAKELGLSQENAQKIVDKMAPVLEGRQQEALTQARQQWAEQAKADKEFGGDKLPENLALAKKALDTFGTPELNTLLRDSGLGNHPEIIRAFVKAGKAISQDTIATKDGGSQNATDKSAVDILYPPKE